jgi:flagellar biosynthesis protein FlhF
LILTKLDEANGLGNLLPLLRSSRLPLSYLTDGQNVPDDIQTAEAARLAQRILGGGGETAMARSR